MSVSKESPERDEKKEKKETIKRVYSTKRKRDIVPEDEDDKLQIDVNLPEPPSKKAKRKEKKQSRKPAPSNDEDAPKEGDASETQAEPTTITTSTAPEAPTRSEYGIWIGNLPFSANRESLRNFLKDKGGIDEDDITRLHMPTADKGKNKGFAYVDFTTEAVLNIALALSEKLLTGRAVLVKNAKSFEGRPEKSEAYGSGAASKKEPSKRIFVGNLSFDITKEEIAEHFKPAGEVEDAFLATFQDSGKCKGYGWIRFRDIEAAKKAVQGYVLEHSEDDNEDADTNISERESSAGSKKLQSEKRRHYINRIHGRPVRCEFAEDSQTRYKKRFGKGAEGKGAETENRSAWLTKDVIDGDAEDADPAPPRRRQDRSKTKDERQEFRRKRHDARTIAPGKALASAQRSTGAIVAAAGTKTTFE